MIENNFIQEYEINHDVCDALITAFHTKGVHTEGLTSRGVVKSIKDSTDWKIEIPTAIEMVEFCSFFDELKKCSDKYIETFEFCNFYAPWGIVENINIQYYKPNQGYHVWHTERSSSSYPIGARHLAFITYLNDVDDGGETEFMYQQLKIKPKKGLTIIFPVDWTHTHRGITSPTQDKYIITGWYSFFQ